MKTLDRQKLDVTNKTRGNIFGWRGQFTPEFAGEGTADCVKAQNLPDSMTHKVYAHNC